MDYQQFSKDFEQKQHEQSEIKLAVLSKEATTLPLKQEVVGYIEEFTRLLDLSNEWFLRSRKEQNPEKKLIAQTMWEFYNKRSDLIVSELEGLV